jgi:tRNA modification GTPase
VANPRDKETIVAIATPPGRGSVGIVRISGTKAKSIGKDVLKRELKPKLAHYGLFFDESGKTIDKGLALFFPGPGSFTGENVLELHGHGNPIILDAILKRCLQLGARQARAGEFSERAFLNGKIDLAQAEATADLINSASEQATKAAIASLQGEFSRQIEKTVGALILARTLVEAAIDFSEEEVGSFEEKKVSSILEESIGAINKVFAAAKQGALLREGMTVVIAGKPNAGKSSLLNCLSGQDSAIVTEVAGTTRDVLREKILVGGAPLHVVDTAGLQESKNVVEQEGVRRAKEEIKKADLLLLVIDSAETKEASPEKLLPEFFKKAKRGSKTFAIIMNKIDISGESARKEICGEADVVYLSAKTKEGVPLLRGHLKQMMGISENGGDVFVARRRHLVALGKAQEALALAKKQLKEGSPKELLAEELRCAQKELEEITGKFTTEELLAEIFSSFCVGK